MISAVISENGTRDYNEDSYYVSENMVNALYVVADGLGGHGKGEVASKIVVDTFKENFEKKIILEDDFLNINITLAQQRILDEQKRINAPTQMKTTCVALLVNNKKCNIAYIGDSRVYVFNKNKISHRTLDHSVPQMLFRAKEIKEKDIRNHPDRNKLLRVIGIPWDTPQFQVLEPIDTSKCQAFLLCSDGFWDFCTEKMMCKFLKKSKTADEWLNLMHDEVLKNGKNLDMDNLTAIAVFC
ncbi:MAG: protein phosphatase 2C domain-containing protein [Clostridia bacterium]